uniref:Uncharacterized protein n=1 Tax=Myoviridae sp. ctXwe21 TaxID=2825123 RepID=A0A8S5PYG1_9CAUD|nr:MAG TPA: hypothetical protein [Myoviridae sp. ctXwe21]
MNVGRNLNVHLCLFTWQYIFGYSYSCRALEPTAG